VAARDWLVRLGVAVVAVALVAGGQVAASPDAASAAAPLPTRQVWLQGDSVLFGALGTVQAELQGDGWKPTIIAFGGLQLTTAIQMFRDNQAALGSVVVIELGNNFCCDISQFSGQIDEAMSVIGPRHVIWLTTALFEPRQQQINALIRAGAARWPNAEVADWGGEVAANPQAVGPDGLHLTVAGRALMAAFIRTHLDAWYDQFSGPSRPVVAGFGAAPSDGPSGQQATAGAPVGLAATADGQGYWVAQSDGSVEATGDAHSLGGTAPSSPADPVVGIAATPDRRGYWLVRADGSVLTFGDAVYHGAAGALRLRQPIVGLAATPDGGGYWLVAGDGGVFAFGDAVFRGSLGAVALNEPVVGLAATPDGGGYWLVAADGGIFAFGDARFQGSTGGMRLMHPVQSMATTADGRGYWLVASDGHVFSFGNARYFGSAMTGEDGGPDTTWIAIAATPNDHGYWLLGENPT